MWGDWDARPCGWQLDSWWGYSHSADKSQLFDPTQSRLLGKRRGTMMPVESIRIVFDGCSPVVDNSVDTFAMDACGVFTTIDGRCGWANIAFRSRHLHRFGSLVRLIHLRHHSCSMIGLLTPYVFRKGCSLSWVDVCGRGHRLPIPLSLSLPPFSLD